MICKNCGNEVFVETLLCPKCGAKLESDFIRPETDWTYGTKADPIPENMRYENMTSQNNNPWTNEGSDNVGYTQSEYSLADIPEKKEKHKRPFWLAIICGLFSFVCSIVLFSFCVTLLYVAVINSSISEVRETFSSSSVSNYSEIPVGAILNKFDSSKEYDSDVTLSEYVYEKLPAADKANTTEEDIAKMLDNPSISEFVGGVMEDYIGLMTGEIDEASVSNESVINVVKENEELVESAIGRELTEEDYSKIDSKLDSINFENNTRISGTNEIPGELTSAFKIARKVLDNTKMIFVGLGIAIGAVLILILLLNLHKPYVVLWYAGSCAVLSSGIGFATAAVINALLDKLGLTEKTNVEMILRFIGNPQNKIGSYSSIFLGVGLTLIAIYAVIAVLRKVLRSRA